MHSQIKVCIYCGSGPPLEDDHIPPKNLFARPRPSNLITVPACSNCNRQASKDDEYFRLVLTLRQDVSEHPDIAALLPNVIRSLKKPRKVGFRGALLKSLRNVPLATPGGIYLGQVGGYNVDLARLDRVASRIIRGLVYHELGIRLDEDYDVAVYSEDGLAHNDLPTLAELRKTILEPLSIRPAKMIGNDVFEYRYSLTDRSDASSAWLLVFYGRIRFLGLVVKLPRLSARLTTRFSGPAKNAGR